MRDRRSLTLCCGQAQEQVAEPMPGASGHPCRRAHDGGVHREDPAAEVAHAGHEAVVLTVDDEGEATGRGIRIEAHGQVGGVDVAVPVARRARP